jgi:hypothetical protein
MMQLQFVRIGRWRCLPIAIVAVSLSFVLQSCTKDEDQPQVESIHRLKIVDEGPESATQPLSAVLDLDYNAEESWWKWRDILLSRLRHHQFEDLDRFADEVREARARFPGGAWKLFEIYDETNEPSAGPDVTEEEWQSHLKLFEEWIGKYPESATARAGYAGTLVRYAWHARGFRPGKDLTSTQSRLFAERLKRAKDVAVEALSLGMRCPHLYAVLLSVGQGEGWSILEYDKVFDAAITYEPLYRAFYHQKGSYLLPRWYGRDGDWQAFAEKSADRLGGAEGEDMFFFIYSDMASFYYGERDLPRLVEPVWDRLKEGFDAKERLHGVTADQRTVFGHYAYVVGDRATVHTTLEKLGAYWNQGLWGSLERDQLMAWVAGTDRQARADFLPRRTN